MSDWSPKELDKLFRQGSEQYDFEYNAEAWTELESLLDKDDRRRGIFWWWLGGIGALILTGGICFFGFEKQETTHADSKIENIDSLNYKKGESQFKTDIPDIRNKTNPDGETNSEKNSQPADDVSRKAIKTTEPTMQPRKEITIKRKINSKKTIKSPPIAETLNSNIFAGVKPVFSDSTSNELQKIRDFSKKDQPSPPVQIPSKIKVPSRIPFLATGVLEINFDTRLSTALPPKKDIETLIAAPDRETDHSRMGNFFIAGLTAGGEYSAVGKDHFSKPNWKIGAHIEYRYGRKYSTSIGLNYIRKKYEAGEGEYIPPKGFWTRKIAPQSTTGTCIILELPVLLAYYPGGYSKNGFIVNLGLTSFFMLQERYHYYYDLPDPDLIREWGTENENRHWFGIGQVSLGYQSLLGRKTSFQIAPYVQIPLTGIGHGKVKLWSLGLDWKMNLEIR